MTQTDAIAEARADFREALGSYGYFCRGQNLPNQVKPKKYTAVEVGAASSRSQAAADRLALAAANEGYRVAHIIGTGDRMKAIHALRARLEGGRP